MKKLLLGLLYAVLASPLAAQVPTKDKTSEVSKISEVSCHDGHCLPKICVAEPTTKKTTKTVYSAKCVEFCLPRCSLFGGCGDCAVNCGRVRTKNVLLKKIITEECPATKCVVVVAPPCAPACPPAGAAAIPAAGATVGRANTAPPQAQYLPQAPTISLEPAR